MPATDAELVRGALGGAEPAFREIVHRYQRPIFGHIVRMLRDPSRAEELAQDTFVKAFSALHSYDTRRRLATWLLTIAHRVAIDELRKGALKTESLDEIDTAGDRRIDPADTGLPTPAGRAERTALTDALQIAMGRLRPEYRQVVTLRYEQELDHDEIAEVTGLPAGTVKSHLHRARRELAGHLQVLGWKREGL